MNRLACAVVLSLVPASALYAQPESRCSVCGVEIDGTINFGYSHTLQLSEHWEITSCPSAAIAVAYASYSESFSVLGPSTLCCPEEPSSTAVTDSDSNSDSGDLAQRPIGAGATAVAAFIGGSYSIGWSDPLNGGMSSSSSFATGAATVFEQDVMCGTSSGDGSSIGYAVMSRNYVINTHGMSGFLQWQDHNQFYSFRFRISENPCEFGPGSADVVTAHALSLRFTEQPSGTSDVRNGMIVLLGDGTVLRCGIFAGSAFSSSVDQDGYTVWSGTLPLSFTTSGSVSSVEEVIIDDRFSTFSGDLDRNGVVDWNDRKLLVLSIGATTTSEEYVGRGDFDVDGDIDSDDYDAYVIVFDAAVACKADYNSSGSVTVQDNFEFLTDYFSSSLNADFNGSGTVTQQDLFAWLAAYIPGC